jgi:hypothetical protein
VESFFNLMGDIMDAKSSRMNASTLGAVQMIKYDLMAKQKTAIECYSYKKTYSTAKTRKLVANLRLASQRRMKEAKEMREKKEKWMKKMEVREKVTKREACRKAGQLARDEISTHAKKIKQKRLAALKALSKKRRIEFPQS